MISQYGEDLAKRLIDPEQTINFQSLIHQTNQLRRSSYDLDAIISRNDKHRQRIIMIDVLKDRDVVKVSGRTLSFKSEVAILVQSKGSSVRLLLNVQHIND
eukprot:scaffold27275_cov47-Cyclotella_meneghiniana.AAC.3